MTPAARLAAAIEICDALNATAQPADRFVRDWFSVRRYAGSKDRAAVTARVYDMLRHRAAFSWRMQGDEARKLAIASLLMEGKAADEIAALFETGGYGPAPLSDAERAAMQAPLNEAMPLHVEYEFPAWLEPELSRAFGADLRAEMQAMAARAPVDLRVNTLRGPREELLGELKALGIEAYAMPYSPFGIRVPSADGLGVLKQSPLFQAGAFEFQDEASQIAAILCGATPGARVLDLAAGGGGKSLALAAIMRDQGEIIAYDANPQRLKDIRPRARRAGAAIIKATGEVRDFMADVFDMVLIDAPCSGSGAWRRSPEAKWRLTPERLKELTALQASMLETGARCVKRGGRLIYATCSLFQCENEEMTAAFLAEARDFHAVSAAHVWQEIVGQAPPFVSENFHGSPRSSGTDGFFACIMVRE